MTCQRLVSWNLRSTLKCFFAEVDDYLFNHLLSFQFYVFKYKSAYLEKKILCFQNHLMFLIIPVFILVQYCWLNATREWLDTTRTTRTGGETMVYGLYRSWIYGDMHIISNTALQPRQYDPYDPYRSYGSWNNGSRVVQLVDCIDFTYWW